MLVRWALPLTAAGVVAAGAIGTSRIGDEVRVRVQQRLARELPAHAVQVQSASLVEGEGIVVRGVSIVDPRLPRECRQLVWVDEIRLACSTSLAELVANPPRITAVRLRRPVVHAVRLPQGGWTLAGLLGGRLLRLKAADVSTALHLAAAGGHAAVRDALLAAGAG